MLLRTLICGIFEGTSFGAGGDALIVWADGGVARIKGMLDDGVGVLECQQ